MENEIRPGFYLDANGEWQKDRRVTPDRRRGSSTFPHHDRRLFGRRKADMEFVERDHRETVRGGGFVPAREHHPRHVPVDRRGFCPPGGRRVRL